jgi:hypothetical protein
MMFSSSLLWYYNSPPFSRRYILKYYQLPTTTLVVLMQLALLKFGWNRHAWDVLPSTVAIGEKFSLSSQISFAMASTCTRLSMLFLTRRILASGYARLQSIIHFAIVWMSTGCLVFVIVVIFQCKYGFPPL